MKVTLQLQNDESRYNEMASMMCATDPWITLRRNHDHCLASLRGDGKEVYAVLAGNNLVGVVVLQVFGSFRIYLQAICVAEPMRGKGVGSRVMNMLEKRVFAESPNFFLCVSDFNIGARKLYYGRGFEKVGILKDFVTEGRTELLLRKTVGSFSSFTPKG